MNAPRRTLLRFFYHTPHGQTNLKPKRAGEFSRTMLIVVPLTLLIWIYAERAQNRDDAVRTLLGVTIADPKLTASLTDSAESPVTISLNGPRGQIDQLKARIEANSVDRRLGVVVPPADATVGEKPVDLTRLLNADPLFSGSGVLVTKTEPSQVRVTVDTLVPREAKVVLPGDLSVTLLNVTFDPPVITVRGPSQAMNSQFGTGEATVAVDVTNLGSTAGTGPRMQDVPLVPPRDSRLSYSVPRVRMSFEVGSTVEDFRIPTVGILIERPLGEDGTTKVIMRRGPVINNVQIRGPASAIARYRGDQPDAILRAVLPIQPDDAGRTDIRRAVKFSGLEPGVTVIDQPYEVTFDVRVLTP